MKKIEVGISSESKSSSLQTSSLIFQNFCEKWKIMENSGKCGEGSLELHVGRTLDQEMYTAQFREKFLPITGLLDSETSR